MDSNLLLILFFWLMIFGIATRLMSNFICMHVKARHDRLMSGRSELSKYYVKKNYLLSRLLFLVWNVEVIWTALLVFFVVAYSIAAYYACAIALKIILVVGWSLV